MSNKNIRREMDAQLKKSQRDFERRLKKLTKEVKISLPLFKW